jgi:hypothetical protein
MISEYTLQYHNNYFMGMLTLLEGGFLRGHDIDWPTTNFFWNIGHSPIEAPLWTTSSKIETNVAPYSPPPLI